MGVLLNPFNPHISTCLHCNRNWLICKAHVTQYTKEWGMFPLCEGCWKDLTERQRLSYHLMLYNMAAERETPWSIVEEAVIDQRTSDHYTYTRVGYQEDKM